MNVYQASRVKDYYFTDIENLHVLDIHLYE